MGNLLPRWLLTLKTWTPGRLRLFLVVPGRFLEASRKLLPGSMLSFLLLAALLPHGALPLLARMTSLAGVVPLRLPFSSYR